MDIVQAVVSGLGQGAYSQSDAPSVGARLVVVEPVPRLELVPYHAASASVTVECYAATKAGAIASAKAVRDNVWARADAEGIRIHSVNAITGPWFAQQPIAGRLRDWRYDILIEVFYSEVSNGN